MLAEDAPRRRSTLRSATPARRLRRLLGLAAAWGALSIAPLGACGDAPLPITQATPFELAADVEVRRDEWGVPHIYAKSGDDGAFVLGYETARDRLFQLDFVRRRVLGRTAEWLGQAALADDRVARAVGFGPLGDAAASELAANDPEVHRALGAYASGISAFMADAAAGRSGAKFPPEYADIDPAYRPEPWRVADTLALLKAELFLLAAHPESDLLAYAIAETSDPGVYLDLYRPEPLEAVHVTEGFPADCSAHAGRDRGREGVGECGGAARRRLSGAGAEALVELASSLARLAGRRRVGPIGASNNWTLCGALTKSGATMLANDPHLDLDLPTNFYEFHLESAAPGAPLRAAGFGFPGAPAVALGHNADAAWGVTTVEADIADAYLETVEADATLFQGAMVPMQVRAEVIRVRKPAKGVSDFDEIEQKVRVVPHHGPVLSDASQSLKVLLGPTKAISLKWLGFGATHEPRAYYDLMRASSFEAFKGALDHFEAGLFNFVYAGRGGDIGYYPHASYPIRARLDPKNPPYGVVPGTGDYEWTGALIPDACIPQAHAPASCRIFTANNDPAGVTADGDVLDDAYYLGGTFDYALRARRIRDRLDALAGGGVTLDDLESIQGDVHSGLADHFLPPLLAAAPKVPWSPAATELRAMLGAWDREDTVEAIAPTVFAAFYSQLLVDVFADDLPLTFAELGTDDRMMAGVLAHLLAGESTPSAHDYLGGKKSSDVLAGALEEVAVSLPKSLGPDKAAWAWGKVHTNTFNHPLGGKYDIGPVPLGGGLSSLDCARYAPTVAGSPVLRPDVFEGPNARILVELGKEGVTMRAVLATGESGVLGDPHHADQLDLWRQARTRETHFERADVVAHTARVLTFPRGFPASGAPE